MERVLNKYFSESKRKDGNGGGEPTGEENRKEGPKRERSGRRSMATLVFNSLWASVSNLETWQLKLIVIPSPTLGEPESNQTPNPQRILFSQI